METPNEIMKPLKEIISEYIIQYGYCPSMTFKGNPNLMDISDDDLMNIKVRSVIIVNNMGGCASTANRVSLIIDLFL